MSHPCTSQRCEPRAAGAALIAFALLALAPVSAQAQAAVESLEVVVTATVVGQCGFSGAPTSVQAGDIEQAGALELGVTVNCNTPFVVGATATHGALVNRTHADDGSGFAFRKPYAMSLELDTDRGVVSGGRCDAADLIVGGACPWRGDEDGQGLSSGQGVSVGRPLRMRIDWSAQSAQPARLAAGEYQDIIRVVIGARA